MGDRIYIDSYDQDDGEEWFTPELHQANNGKTYCINGTHPKYPCMMNDHLINTIKWIERNAKTGIEVYHGGGSCAEDMWMDVEEIYGEEAKEHMNYNIYIKEAKKRKLKW